MGGRMSLLDRVRAKLRVIGKGSPDRPVRPAPLPEVELEPEPESPRGEAPVRPYVESLVADNRVVLFMKGSPEQPSCGFSANVAAILSRYAVGYQHFDVLLDDEVRQDIKEFSSWPTIPQLYVEGQFVGGSDIVTQLHESGELQGMLAG